MRGRDQKRGQQARAKHRIDRGREEGHQEEKGETAEGSKNEKQRREIEPSTGRRGQRHT